MSGLNESLGGGDKFVQGGGGDFGGGGAGGGANGAIDLDASDDAYAATGIPTSGNVQPDYGQRRVQLNLGKRNVYLGLHQPLYKDIDTGTAKIMKLCNVTASILLIIGGFYRLMASFGGPVVLPLCNKDAYRDRYCPGMADPDQCYLSPSVANHSIAEMEKINCDWVLQYAQSPADGFPNFVVAAFVLFYGMVAWLEEVYENTVKGLMNHLHFLATLWGRGLFYLFMSSVIMTHSYSLIMITSSMVMALAFVYIILHFLSTYTNHAERFGIRKSYPSPEPEVGVGGPAEGSLYAEQTNV